MVKLDKDYVVRAAVLAGSLVVGVGGAVQVGVNTKLGQHFGYGLFGTLMSFATGWLLLCVMVLVETIVCSSRSAVQPAPNAHLLQSDPKNISAPSPLPLPQAHAVSLPQAADRVGSPSGEPSPATMAIPVAQAASTASTSSRRLPLSWSPGDTPLKRPWLLLPGALGVTFVCLSIVISGTIGFALWWIPVIAAQLWSSAVLDHVGWAIPAPKRVTVVKACGLLFAVIGAILTVVERLLPNTAAGQAPVSPGMYAGCILGAIIAGVLMPVQAGLNRQASGFLPSRLQATWWSFTMGCVTVLVAFAANQAAAAPVLPLGLPTPSSVGDHLRLAFATSFPGGWWMYSGGVLGVAYIGSSILWTPIVGSAPYFVCLVCGQLIGSAWLDAAPILPASTWPAEYLTATGTSTGTGGGGTETGGGGTAAAIPITPMRGTGIGLVIAAAVLMGFG